MNSRKVSSFLRIALISWTVVAMWLVMAYECNLRAYLMSVDFEPEINTDKDIFDQGVKLYFAREGAETIDALYQVSPLPEQRALYKEAKENEEDRFFTFDRGTVPFRIEDRIASEGKYILKKAGPIMENQGFNELVIFLPCPVLKWHHLKQCLCTHRWCCHA